MYSHIVVGARDLARMTAFYGAVLAPFGLDRVGDGEIEGQPGVLRRHAGRRWPQFWIQPPFNGLPATWRNGVQVSFAAPSREIVVDVLWRTTLANGGSDDGASGLGERYAPDFYGACCRNPEGNKLCFVHAAD